MLFNELKTLEAQHDFSREVNRDILSNKAVIAHSQGDYETSIKFQLESNKLSRDLDDPIWLATGLSSLGAVYDYAGRYDDALNAYQEALSLAKDINAPHLEQEVALNLVSFYIDLNRLDEAVKVGENALALGHYEATDYVRNNLAVAYLDLKQNQNAKTHFEALISESENTTLCCNAWARLSALYHKENQSENCALALTEALNLAQKTGAPIVQSRVITSCMQYGEKHHKKQAKTLLKNLDKNAIPPVARAEFEEVLRQSGESV